MDSAVVHQVPSLIAGSDYTVFWRVFTHSPNFPVHDNVPIARRSKPIKVPVEAPEFTGLYFVPIAIPSDHNRLYLFLNFTVEELSFVCCMYDERFHIPNFSG